MFPKQHTIDSHTQAGIRGQSIRELVDDILEKFNPSDLLLTPETLKRLYDIRPKSVLAVNSGYLDMPPKPEEEKVNEHS